MDLGAALKDLIKRVVFGHESRPRRIGFGLLRGLRLVTDPQRHAQRLLGLYEKEIECHIRKATARARTAVDIGAHDGWYATFFASRPNISKVLACDRNSVTIGALTGNLNLNDLSRKVALHHVTVGSSKSASCRSLDDLLAKQEPPFVIKVDVDGGELDVLMSGRAVLTEQKCELVVETHSAELEADCLRYLQELGYDTTVIPNAWYRRFIPELRMVPHNRWFVAQRNP